MIYSAILKKNIKLNELYDNNEDPSKHFPVKKSDKK